jgi:hypothetical protein
MPRLPKQKVKPKRKIIQLVVINKNCPDIFGLTDDVLVVHLSAGNWYPYGEPSEQLKSLGEIKI